jgi:hypothetical protein
MAVEANTALATILVTDLVGSTALLQDVGDERGQRIFRAHRKALQDTISSNGGRHSKWLGDGLLAVFQSTADAVRCAIRMQQVVQHPVAGHRLEIRIGLHCGEVTQRGEDYFGETVELADTICNSGDGGQILCSALVTELLLGRQAFTFQVSADVYAKDGQSLPVCEVQYEVDKPAVLLDRPPFTGRQAEMQELEAAFRNTVQGSGALVLLAGEPGIGKSRLTQELMDIARDEGATVLAGQCYEGEWTPPYGPFAEALESFVERSDSEELRRDVGAGAAAIARFVPALRLKLPELAEPAPIRPDEERTRLFDAVAQFLKARSAATPTVFILDDLHWADSDSIAMLRHVARLTGQNRLLIVGAYRDVELNRQHPLADALAALQRETNYQRIALRGLEQGEVRSLLAVLSEGPAPEPLVSAIADRTYGNPYFLREVLLHLVESGQLYQDGEWVAATRVKGLGIPEGVRQVIGRRLSRLSDDANRLLATASAFRGNFAFDLSARVSGLAEITALDALDEALNAQLLRPSGAADRYAFSHALIRDTLYDEMNPSRQVRLHRLIAESIEQAYQAGASEHAAELAYQYHQSAALPGSERGVPYALLAADRSEEAYAFDELATFIRMALELLPDADPQNPRLRERLGLALAWALDFPAALAALQDAANAIAASESSPAAAVCLAGGAKTMARAGFFPGAWELASSGLSHIEDERDGTWAWLMSLDLMRREAQDPEQPGIPLETPERQEICAAVRHVPYGERPPLSTPFASRSEVFDLAADDPVSLTYLAGDFRRSIELLTEDAPRHETQGRIARATNDWSLLARCYGALGAFSDAWSAYERAAALAERIPGPSPQTLQVFSTRLELRFSTEYETAEPLQSAQPLLQQPAQSLNYAAAPIRAVASVGYAYLGQVDEALHGLESLLPALSRAPGWAPNYTLMANMAAAVLWVLERTDHADEIELSLKEKVLTPDFRFPMQDGRLSMARLSAMRGDQDAARDWFSRARTALEEQGARPLLAITDLNEAEMYLRSGMAADADPAAGLLARAIDAFEALGMPGWTSYAGTLG